MATEEIKNDDDLISSFGNKVPYCRGCKTASFDDDAITEVTDEATGKSHKICPYCADNLVMRSENKIKGDLTSGAVSDPGPNAPHSTVAREFNSTFGRVKMYFSAHSYFSPFVYLNGRLSPAIKRIIDEDFSGEAQRKSMVELVTQKGVLVRAVSTLDWMHFIQRMKGIIDAVHLDPQAPPYVDLDPALLFPKLSRP